MTRDTRRTICKIANYMTQKGANQSEAWKSAWKMYNEGIFVSLEGTNWTDSQVGLRSNIGAYIAIINCNGKYGIYKI